jgi:P-type Ca2+ transporter type 2C
MTNSAVETTLVTEGPWQLGIDAVVRGLATDPARGLASTEAVARLATFGPNELVEHAHVPAWRLFVGQFTNTMIVVLAAAAVITAVIGDRKDTLVIGAIIVLNAVVAFIQEYRAEQAMAALRRLTAEEARVVRDGSSGRGAAARLVPGDLVVLGAGDELAGGTSSAPSASKSLTMPRARW